MNSQKVFRIGLLLLSFLLMFGCVVAAPDPAAVQGKKLLAIFAHPDDEITIAPLFARYAREGVTVRLAIVTDGQKGGRPPGPVGEELKEIRAAEVACSAAALGIEAPILMEFVDGDVAEQVNQVKAAIEALLIKHQPDIVVTWGPEGGYGHKDHRMVSAIVTGVFQVGGEGMPDAVFYPATPSFQVDKFEPKSQFGNAIKALWGVTDEQYLQYKVAVSHGDIAATKVAAECHASQWDATTLTDINALIDAGDNNVYLRKSHHRGQIKNRLF